MEYYFDIRYDRTMDEPLQILFVKDGIATGINKNNHNYYDASDTYIDYKFAEIDLVEVTKEQVDKILSKWGVHKEYN